MQARDASLQNFKAPLYHSSATFFSIIITNFWFWVQKRDHEVGSSCISAVTNNEAIGSIAKLFSNCAIVKNALVMSSYMKALLSQTAWTYSSPRDVVVVVQARERQNTIIYSETRLIRKPKGHVLLPVLSGAGSKKKTPRIHFFWIRHLNEKCLIS